MKKFLVLPLLLTLICCTITRDKRIVNDFLSVQKEVQNGDSIYIHSPAICKTHVIDIYDEVLARKDSDAMTGYYYSPDTLSVWPFLREETNALQERFFCCDIWRRNHIKYDKIKVINGGAFKDYEFYKDFSAIDNQITYKFSRPIVKGKTALIYFSSGRFTENPEKYGVFVLKKINGKWQEIGVMNRIIPY